MPRPKVLPEDRQRTYKACLVCKASKIRCDSELPCSSCVKRGRESSCVYSDTARRRRTRTAPPQAQQQQPPQTRPQSQPQNQQPTRDFSVPPPLREVPLAHLRTPSVSSNGNVNETIVPWSKEPSVHPSGERGRESLHPCKENSHMPHTGNGEAASLSFLYFLRRTLKPYVGVIRFTDIERDNTMHELEVRHVNSDNLSCSPTQMYQLLDYYFEAVCKIFVEMSPLTYVQRRAVYLICLRQMRLMHLWIKDHSQVMRRLQYHFGRILQHLMLH